MDSIYTTAAEGSEEAVARLVEHDPQLVHAPNRHGQTPLLFASVNRHEGVVRLLLERGAGVNVQDYLGSTPLYSACASDRFPAAVLLLAHGADPGLADKWGWTPLVVAAFRGRTEIVRVLLNDPRGAATINCVTLGRKTALWWACHGGRTEVAQVLLEHGADPSIASRDGRTPLEVATVEGNQGCVELLKEAERAYLLFKARCLADAVSVRVPPSGGGGEVVEHAVKRLKADTFADLLELMG